MIDKLKVVILDNGSVAMILSSMEGIRYENV